MTSRKFSGHQVTLYVVCTRFPDTICCVYYMLCIRFFHIQDVVYTICCMYRIPRHKTDGYCLDFTEDLDKVLGGDGSGRVGIIPGVVDVRLACFPY